MFEVRVSFATSGGRVRVVRRARRVERGAGDCRDVSSVGVHSNIVVRSVPISRERRRKERESSVEVVVGVVLDVPSPAARVDDAF